MSARRKGVSFEREVARAFAEAGFTVRGLEAAGDHLVVNSSGGLLHVECKRQERLKLPEWLAQMERDCPPHAARVLVFKQSRRPIYAAIPLAQYIDLLSRQEEQ